MEISAIALVVVGVVLATVTDSTVSTNMMGVVLSAAAILFSAVYQACHYNTPSPIYFLLGILSMQLPINWH